MHPMALMEEIRCARKAFAASFDSSDDQVDIVSILSGDTHLRYTSRRALIANLPSSVSSSPPINTRSGFVKSRTAFPSERNSGLDKTWCLNPFEFSLRIFAMLWADLTGTVDFSTTI